MRHKFIVFEGIDGAGKATQVELLRKRLATAGRVFVFRSPRYETPTGTLVKRALYGEFGNFVGLHAYLSAMPYLLDFAAERDELAAALEKGTVISDRFLPSTLAYHGAKLSGKERKAFLDFVETLMYGRLNLPRPTRVVYLDTPVSNAQKLLSRKKKDQHEKSFAYQRRVAGAYRQLAKRKEWRVVSCVKNGRMRSPEEIHESVWKAVQWCDERS